MPKTLALSDLRNDLAYVQTMLQRERPNTTGWFMWESRKSVLEQEIAETEHSVAARAKVALIFDGAPVRDAQEIRLDFASKALQDYQDLVAAAHASMATTLGKKGPLRGRSQSRLYIRETIHGSFGFMLSEADVEQTEGVATPLKVSVEHVTSVLQHVKDGTFTTLGLDPRFLNMLKRWAKTLRSAKSHVTIASDDAEVSFNDDAIERAAETLDQVEVVDVPETIEGELIGYLPDDGTFEFSTVNGIVKGSANDDLQDRWATNLDEYIRVLHVPAVGSVHFVRTMRGANVEKEQIVLDLVTPKAM